MISFFEQNNLKKILLLYLILTTFGDQIAKRNNH